MPLYSCKRISPSFPALLCSKINKRPIGALVVDNRLYCRNSLCLEIHCNASTIAGIIEINLRDAFTFYTQRESHDS